MKPVARSTLIRMILFGLGAIPAGLIVATATYGLGLLVIPAGFYYRYRHTFKVPSMLSRKALVSDSAADGIVVR